jgi:hypothetical protein
MFATVIGRLYERSFGEIEAANTTFSRIATMTTIMGNMWTGPRENGILGGYGNGTFGPDDPVTREQMEAILYRFADFSASCRRHRYRWLSRRRQYLKLGPERGPVLPERRHHQGRDGENFFPQGTATRAEVAVILERFIENALD